MAFGQNPAELAWPDSSLGRYQRAMSPHRHDVIKGLRAWLAGCVTKAAVKVGAPGGVMASHAQERTERETPRLPRTKTPAVMFVDLEQNSRMQAMFCWSALFCSHREIGTDSPSQLKASTVKTTRLHHAKSKSHVASHQPTFSRSQHGRSFLLSAHFDAPV